MQDHLLQKPQTFKELNAFEREEGFLGARIYGLKIGPIEEGTPYDH